MRHPAKLSIILGATYLFSVLISPKMSASNSFNKTDLEFSTTENLFKNKVNNTSVALNYCNFFIPIGKFSGVVFSYKKKFASILYRYSPLNIFVVIIIGCILRIYYGKHS